MFFFFFLEKLRENVKVKNYFTNRKFGKLLLKIKKIKLMINLNKN